MAEGAFDDIRKRPSRDGLARELGRSWAAWKGLTGALSGRFGPLTEDWRYAGTTVGRFVPFKDATFTFHTNHPLRNLDYSPRFLEHLRSRSISPSDYEHPCPRFEALNARLKDNSVVFDVEMLKDIFGDRETIVNNSGTFGCTIMALGRSPELHISPGRPDTEPFRVFGFGKD
jgi:hypothetical protein